MALDHPLLGVGPDNFLYAYRSGYLLPSAWQEPNLNHPHTLLLDWWTRLGIPGVCCWGWRGWEAALLRWLPGCGVAPSAPWRWACWPPAPPPCARADRRQLRRAGLDDRVGAAVWDFGPLRPGEPA